MQPFDPEWVQAGELGFAFIVVLLCATLVIYVLRPSAEREARLFKALENYAQKLGEVVAVLEKMKDEMANRLDQIEDPLTAPNKRRQ